jgi:hypothetical protein
MDQPFIRSLDVEYVTFHEPSRAAAIDPEGEKGLTGKRISRGT